MENVFKINNLRDVVSWLLVMFFWWMNDVLIFGNECLLIDEDLFLFFDDFKFEVFVEKVELCWLDEFKWS